MAKYFSLAYVYRHIRHDKNEPFYIGIGSVSNFYRAYSKYGRNKIWNDIVAKTTYDVEILFDDITWVEACEKEKEFISLYGRISDHTGVLSNLTMGGDGTIGITDEVRNKLRMAKLGKKVPDNIRKNMSEGRLGNNNRGITVVNHDLEITAPSAVFLAEQLGINKSTLWTWLSGKTSPPYWFKWEYNY